jgi:hypothetical protein
MRSLVQRLLVPAVGAVAVMCVAAGPASAAVIPGCTEGGGVTVCIDPDPNPLLGTNPIATIPVLVPMLNPTPFTTVYAYLDTFTVHTILGPSVTITCVTLNVPPTISPCNALGFTLTNRVPLVAQPVDLYSPSVSTLTTVSVCWGLLSVDIAGKFGVGDVPILIPC